MNKLFLFARSSHVQASSTRIKLINCLMTIVAIAFYLAAIGGCSNSANENAGGNSSANAEPVNFEGIKEQINNSLKYRQEVLAKFNEESQEKNMGFLRERAKQEQLAMHLRTSVKQVQKHIEYVKTAKSFKDRFTVLNVAERLAVAKIAESTFADSDETAVNAAIASAFEKQKKIEEERELLSTSRYEEKKKMKAAADVDHPEFQAALKPLVKDQTPQEFGFVLDEVTGKFSESAVNFLYKNGAGKLLLLGINIQTEPTKYVHPDRIEKREHYMVAVESKKQLVLQTGRLFIAVKTDTDLEKGDLWKCFKGITDDEQMKQLADEFK